MWKFLACCVITLAAVVDGGMFKDILGQGPLVEKFEQVVDSIRSLKAEALEAQNADWPPKFCNALDCPKYDMVENHTEYEVRRYGEAHWVSTNMAGVDYEQALYPLFMKLYRYIKGENARGEKMDLVVPVAMRITPGQGPACVKNFTMAFFIPPKVSEPPKPTDPKVYLQSSNVGKVYVRSFSGVALAQLKDWVSEAEALAKALPKSAKYVKDFYYTAGYDSPFSLNGRHNEIWFVAE